MKKLVIQVKVGYQGGTKWERKILCHQDDEQTDEELIESVMDQTEETLGDMRETQ